MLVVIALIFGIWGVVVSSVGLFRSLSPSGIDLDPAPIGRIQSRLLTTGGAVIAAIALVVALGTVPPDERRSMGLRLVRAMGSAAAIAAAIASSLGIWPGTLSQRIGFIVSASACAIAAHWVEGRIQILKSDSAPWLEELAAKIAGPPL
jgi:hypothetical protein